MSPAICSIVKSRNDRSRLSASITQSRYFQAMRRLVLLVAVRVGVAREVEPRPRPALAVVRRGEQAVDELLVGVRARVGQERVDLRRASAAGRRGRGSEPAHERLARRPRARARAPRARAARARRHRSGSAPTRGRARPARAGPHRLHVRPVHGPGRRLVRRDRRLVRSRRAGVDPRRDPSRSPTARAAAACTASRGVQLAPQVPHERAVAAAGRARSRRPTSRPAAPPARPSSRSRLSCFLGAVALDAVPREDRTRRRARSRAPSARLPPGPRRPREGTPTEWPRAARVSSSGPTSVGALTRF